jgi:hypothetical protein
MYNNWPTLPFSLVSILFIIAYVKKHHDESVKLSFVKNNEWNKKGFQMTKNLITNNIILPTVTQALAIMILIVYMSMN